MIIPTTMTQRNTPPSTGPYTLPWAPAEVVRYLIEVTRSRKWDTRPGGLVTVNYEQARWLLWHRITQRLQANNETWYDEPRNRPVIANLLRYVLNLENTVFNPRRGILLYGTFGCGKTTLMEDLAAVGTVLGRRTWRYANMKTIELEHRSASDLDFLKKYFVGNWLFDDLGYEDSTKRYGNEEDAWSYILHQRALQHERTGYRTHVITHRNLAETQRLYDPNGADGHLGSRMAALLQPVPLAGPNHRNQCKIIQSHRSSS